MDYSMLGFLVLHHLPKLAFTQVHWVGVAKPSGPLSSPSLSALDLSHHQGLFAWVTSSRQVAKNQSFSFSISPSNEYSGLISFRIDWLDLVAVQGTFKSLLQHHSSKAPILWCSAFFIVQLSHPYMTIGKTKALTRQTFVDKVMSLLFNMLSSWSDLHTFKKGVGEGNGTPLQYSCLENPMDRGAWQAIVHGVAKSQICLSN